MQEPAGGDQDRGPGFIAAAIITTTAALTTVCLRMYVRTRIVHAVGLDDWAIIISMVISYSLSTVGDAFLIIRTDLLSDHTSLQCSGNLEWPRQTRILSRTTGKDRISKIQCPSDRGPCPEHIVLESIHLPIAFALNRRRRCQEKEILSLHTNLDPVYL